MDVCPVTAITRNEETGALISQCGSMYGLPHVHSSLSVRGVFLSTMRTGKAMKCDLCDGDPVLCQGVWIWSVELYRG